MKTKIKKLVVDSGAIIKNVPLWDYAEELYCVEEVPKEIKDKQAKHFLASLPVSIIYRKPSPNSIQFIIEFAKKTGDYASLSLVDMKILALTYDLEVEAKGTSHLKKQPTPQKTEQIASNKPPENETLSKIEGFYIPKKQKRSTSCVSSKSDNLDHKKNEDEGEDCDGEDDGNFAYVSDVTDYAKYIGSLIKQRDFCHCPLPDLPEHFRKWLKEDSEDEEISTQKLYIPFYDKNLSRKSFLSSEFQIGIMDIISVIKLLKVPLLKKAFDIYITHRERGGSPLERLSFNYPDEFRWLAPKGRESEFEENYIVKTAKEIHIYLRNFPNFLRWFFHALSYTKEEFEKILEMDDKISRAVTSLGFEDDTLFSEYLVIEKCNKEIVDVDCYNPFIECPSRRVITPGFNTSDSDSESEGFSKDDIHTIENIEKNDENNLVSSEHTKFERENNNNNQINIGNQNGQDQSVESGDDEGWTTYHSKKSKKKAVVNSESIEPNEPSEANQFFSPNILSDILPNGEIDRLSTYSEGEYQNGGELEAYEEEYEEEEDEDEEGWITPSNIQSLRLGSVNNNDKGEDIEDIEVACITGDFAMQNTLKHIGLKVVEIDGKLINTVRTFILRCTACFKTTSKMDKIFCPTCGHKCLKKVSVTTNPDGTQKIWISTRKPLSTRGLKYSLPAPKGGKHAVNPLLVPDQREAQQRATRLGRSKNDPLGEDYGYKGEYQPFAIRDVYSRAAQLGIRADKNKHRGIFYWEQKNPNVPLKRGTRKKKH